MTFNEKSTWIMAISVVGTYLAYVAIIFGRTEDIPLTEVSYVPWLLLTVVAIVVLSIVLHIAIWIVSPRDVGKEDQRDWEIDRFGDLFGQWPVAVGAMAALGMSMAEMDHFWIAQVIYFAFVLSTLVGSAAKIVAYRRGFQQW